QPEDVPLRELAVKAAADPRDEEAALRELVRRFPEGARYGLELGALLVGQGRQKEARDILAPLTKEGAPAQRAEAHYHLARSHYRRDQLEKSLEHLDKAEESDPETVHNVRACMLRGNVLEELGRPADAARVYQVALTIDRDA